MSKCGWTRYRSDTGVELHVHDDGRASLRGVVSCGRRTCPGCGPRLLARDAELVEAGVREHGYERTLMVTMTVRHWRSHELLALRRGIVRAWIDMQRQRAYKALLREHGASVFVRVVEVTHREENGWHVHYHALLFLDENPLGERELRAFRAAWFGLWRRSVVVNMGRAHRPSAARGVHIGACHRANYLTKLGLEVTDAAQSKEGKAGGRSYWRIGRDWLDSGADVGAADARKLGTFIRDMQGCRVVSWPHRGDYTRAKLDERHPEEKAPIRETAILHDFEWDAVKRLELDDEEGRVVVMRAAERAPPGEVARVVDELVSTLLREGERCRSPSAVA